MILWTVLAILLPTLFCAHQLHIVGPPSLLVRLNNTPIPVHSSALGFTPVGSSINGILMVSQPLNACEPLTSSKNSQLHSFYLVSSADCLASQKAKNIFQADGYAAIIIKDQHTQIEKHGSKVQMPVVEISPTPAQIIIDFQALNPTESILARIYFSSSASNRTDSKITMVDLWMSSSSLDAYNFIQAFRSFYSPQDKTLRFRPKFVLDTKGADKIGYHLGCLSSGRYCAPELELRSRIGGRQVVEEDLRQLLIFRSMPTLWWNYVANWKLDCLSKDNIFTESGVAELCSNSSMVKAGIDPQTIKQLTADSFRGPKVEIEDNIHLMAELEDQQQLHLKTWPKVYINQHPFDTDSASLSMNVINIEKEICESQFPNYSSTCLQLDPSLSPSDDDQWVIGVILLSLAFLMMLIVLVYKQVMKRRMKNQIQEEVEKVLEQYYTYAGATRLQDV